MSEQPPAVSAPYGTEFLPPGERRHEISDASVFWILTSAVSMAIGAVLVHVFLWFFFRGLELVEPRKERRPAPPADARPMGPPEPRLQTDFIADYKAMLAEQDARLSQYSWTDKPNGIIHIPISRAMELVEEHGLPEWKLKNPQELTRDAFGNLRAGGKESKSESANEH
jgi:hypothetical protein